MNKDELRAARKALGKIVTTREKLKKLRDQLRDEISEFEDILESVGESIELFSSGTKDLQDGLDELCKYM